LAKGKKAYIFCPIKKNAHHMTKIHEIDHFQAPRAKGVQLPNTRKKGGFVQPAKKKCSMSNGEGPNKEHGKRVSEKRKGGLGGRDKAGKTEDKSGEPARTWGGGQMSKEDRTRIFKKDGHPRGRKVVISACESKKKKKKKAYCKNTSKKKKTSFRKRWRVWVGGGDQRKGWEKIHEIVLKKEGRNFCREAETQRGGGGKD